MTWHARMHGVTGGAAGFAEGQREAWLLLAARSWACDKPPGLFPCPAPTLVLQISAGWGVALVFCCAQGDTDGGL